MLSSLSNAQTRPPHRHRSLPPTFLILQCANARNAKLALSFSASNLAFGDLSDEPARLAAASRIDIPRINCRFRAARRIPTAPVKCVPLERGASRRGSCFFLRRCEYAFVRAAQSRPCRRGLPPACRRAAAAAGGALQNNSRSIKVYSSAVPRVRAGHRRCGAKRATFHLRVPRAQDVLPV